MRWRFGDISVKLKVLLVPAGMIAAMLGLAVYAAALLAGNVAGLERLTNTTIDPSIAVGDFANSNNHWEAQLYRVISVGANENDAAHLSALVQMTRNGFDDFVDSFRTIRQAAQHAGIPQSTVDQLQQNFADFVSAADGVLDMADGEPAMALTMMTGTARKLATFNEGLDHLSTELAARRASGIQSLEATMNTARMVFMATIGFVAVLAIVVSVVISRRLAAPMLGLADAVPRIARKEYDVTIPAVDQNDEVGSVARAIDVLRQQSREADRLAAEQAEEHKKQASRTTQVEALARGFDANMTQAIGVIAASTGEIRSRAQTVASIADRTGDRARTVAAVADDASSSVNSVAAAAEQLTASIGEISRQVVGSARVAQTAAEKASRTNDIVLALSDTAGRIGEVVDLISNIAGQTNLLALNATIEAARAGDAGRGFAVVAGEVKALAQATAKATEEIVAHINATQAATGEAVAAIRDIVETISEVNQIATTIATAVEEQGAATHEISRGIQLVAASTGDVSGNISDVSGAAGEAGLSAAAVLQAANDLGSQANTLRETVSAFLDGVRAA
jgi:Methyl-accepting chemotaxis protein